MPRVNYGLDAPTVVGNFVLLGVSLTLGGVILAAVPSRAVHGFASAALSMGICFAISALIMLWGSLIGKFRLRDWVLNRLELKGGEQILDVGCGHGLMLIGAAKRLRGGHATGIDIWSHTDQAANSPEATRRNAELEGVAERIDVRDGDARAIPFPDATFDVVVSSLALHNIENAEERRKALSEIARVLKPGGRIGMIDIFKGGEYLDYFTSHGFRIVAKKTTIEFLLVTRLFVLTRSSS
jgi:ubiquinone/menaquinone biosynthesis C-methylase UbiE